MRPMGSQIPRIYGLPKTHKDGCPVRPILSMVKSPQHKVAQWFLKLLEHVLERNSKCCLSASSSKHYCNVDNKLSALLFSESCGLTIVLDIYFIGDKRDIRETENG